VKKIVANVSTGPVVLVTVLTDGAQLKLASYLLIMLCCSARLKNHAPLMMTMVRYASKGIAQGAAKLSMDPATRRKQPSTEIAAEEGIRQLDTGLVNFGSIYCKEERPQSCNYYQVLPSR
jgi:hypothetical protein